MFNSICKFHPLFQNAKKEELTLQAAVLPYQGKSSPDLLNQIKSPTVKKVPPINLGKLQPNPIYSRSSRANSSIAIAGKFEDGQLTSPRARIKDKRENSPKRASQLSGIEYIKFKRQQSRDQNQFYDIGGLSYKNYKYEKVNLQRQEYNFLQQLPLDFAGKGLSIPRKKQSIISSPEITLGNIRKQNLLSGEKLIGEQGEEQNQNAVTDTSQPQNTKLNDKGDTQKSFMNELKQQLKQNILDRQSKTGFLEIKSRIKKNLSQLDQKITTKLSDSRNTTQTLREPLLSKGEIIPTTSSSILKNLNSSSLNASVASSKSGQNHPRQVQWISPLLKHENMMRSPHGPQLSGSDYILKAELLERLEEEEINATSKSINRSYLNKSVDNKKGDSKNQNDQSDSMCLNVIFINHGMKGNGKKMKSLLQSHSKSKNSLNKSISTGDISKTFKKKTRSMQLVEEYNRLLEMQKSEMALANTKRIPTQLPTAEAVSSTVNVSSSSSAYLRLNDLSNKMLLPSLFLRETTFFGLYVREEQQIRDKIMGSLTEREGGISFERYLEFYQIFAFSQTPFKVLISFFTRYFLFSSGQIYPSIELKKFLKDLKVLSAHPQLADREDILEQWEIALQNHSDIDYDMNFQLRQKHLNDIFSSQLINPNLLLKLLFQ